MLSCYEAGRDGFWLHRYLVSCGINNQVLEPSSIKVDRRQRRAKTDRLDVERMLVQLLRYLDGDTEELHVVRVPTPQQEDARRLHREQLRLKEERKGHRIRINALLVTQGIALKVPSDFRQRLERLTGWDGSPMGSDLRAELEREYSGLELVEAQLRTLEDEQQRRLEQWQIPQMQTISQLMGSRDRPSTLMEPPNGRPSARSSSAACGNSVRRRPLKPVTPDCLQPHPDPPDPCRAGAATRRNRYRTPTKLGSTQNSEKIVR